MRATLFFMLTITSLPVWGQVSSLQGQVKDTNGDPLDYAHVFIRRLSLGTYTNSEGHFQLLLAQPPNNDRLEVSHLGYVPYRQWIGNQSGPMAVQLQETVTELAEVMVKPESVTDILQKMARNCWNTTPNSPIGHEVFFKEKKYFNTSLENYTEAVLEVYYPYRHPFEVQLVKGRNRGAAKTEGVRMTWAGSPFTLGSEGVRCTKVLFFWTRVNSPITNIGWKPSLSTKSKRFTESALKGLPNKILAGKTGCFISTPLLMHWSVSATI